MRLCFWCVLLAVGLTAALFEWRAVAEPTYRGGDLPVGMNSSGVITHVVASEGQPTTVIVVEAARRVMMVYHVGREDGGIQLKSVRNFRWDQELVEYNSHSPLPEQIRKGLERQ